MRNPFRQVRLSKIEVGVVTVAAAHAKNKAALSEFYSKHNPGKNTEEQLLAILGDKHIHTAATTAKFKSTYGEAPALVAPPSRDTITVSESTRQQVWANVAQ